MRRIELNAPFSDIKRQYITSALALASSSRALACAVATYIQKIKLFHCEIFRDCLLKLELLQFSEST